MNENEAALLKLIRISFGMEQPTGFADSVDWNIVFDLSIRHGVVAIVVDGIQQCREKLSENLFLLESIEYEDLKYKWLGYTMYYEGLNKQKLMRINCLSKFLLDNGLNMMILKGFGLSLYYPHPAYRPLGDLDIYIMGEDLNLSSRADMLVKSQLKIDVTKSKIGHHSHFDYQGLSVENHYEFSNTYFGGESNYYLERTLKELSTENPRKFGDIYLPSVNFNAVFLMWHMATHLCSERITLKQLCDWMLFINVEHDNINWSRIETIWRETGLYEFASVINGLLVDYFGMNRGLVPNLSTNVALKRRVVLDSLKMQRRSQSRVIRFFDYCANGWKYKLTTKEGWEIYMLKSARLHLFHAKDIKEELLFE